MKGNCVVENDQCDKVPRCDGDWLVVVIFAVLVQKPRQNTAKDVKKDQSTAKPTSSKKVPDRNTKQTRIETETTRGPNDDLECGEEDEADEQNRWEDTSRYPHYNDQDEDYYFDNNEDFFFYFITVILITRLGYCRGLID
ncbi:uncharacterized protein LOC141651771 [Silene latifolia]|uniref:uncharacterized protein LOC141651771 n=1 Tax=Silene latifolia TaxID=37657 RepID=UPI003D76D745